VARDKARELARKLVRDLLWLGIWLGIMLGNWQDGDWIPKPSSCLARDTGPDSIGCLLHTIIS
jgi:hypothetical protein